MSIEETQAVMDAYVAALVGREDIAPYFSDDVAFELVDVGQRVEGRDEVVDAIVELHEQTFDAHPEVTNLVVGEGTAAAEVVFVGTHTGDFAGIPATGQQVAVPYAVFYDLADGKITALRIYGFVTGLVAALTAEAPRHRPRRSGCGCHTPQRRRAKPLLEVSRVWESNPRPHDYKSSALPTELTRRAWSG